jgi:hypothetical protein
VQSTHSRLESVTTLTDFDNPTDLNLTDLFYSTDASIIPWRRYKLKSSGPLQSIDFNVYVDSSNGSQLLLQIPPSMAGIVRASFFRVN